MADRWITKNDAKYCTAHDVVFDRGGICQACVADPGPPITVQESTVQDLAALEMESNLLLVCKTLKKMAEVIVVDGTARDKLAAAKFYDTYIKAVRAWREIHAERMQIESDERLREHDAQISGLRKSN